MWCVCVCVCVCVCAVKMLVLAVRKAGKESSLEHRKLIKVGVYKTNYFPKLIHHTSLCH